jgi:WhiB family redox-sensing transcriptional regulator
MNGTEPRPIAALWEWQESAACRGVDPSHFFSPPGERGEQRRERERRARMVCDRCAVRRECGQFALAIGEEHGTWGGTTDRERIAVLRRPQRSGARGMTEAVRHGAARAEEAAK